jgi:hypothetical protein
VVVRQLAAPVVNQPKAPFDEEESLATMKGYRTVVDQRLKELDEKLKNVKD